MIVKFSYESKCLCVETKLQVQEIGEIGERGALQNASEKERWTAKGYGCKEHGKRKLPLAFSLPPTPHLFQLIYWLVRCEDVLASRPTSASNQLWDFGKVSPALKVSVSLPTKSLG